MPLIEDSMRFAVGLVETRTTRGGVPVELYDAEVAQDYDPAEGGRWVTFCARHGQFCQHETRRLAQSSLAAPREWCEACARGEE